VTLGQTGVVKLQDAAVAIGDGAELLVAGRSNVVIQVFGTFVGTITWEATMDGATWAGAALADLASATRARALTTTVAGLFMLDEVGGLQKVRARISAYTSGTVNAWANASDD
jgi:hypothetical protein